MIIMLVIKALKTPWNIFIFILYVKKNIVANVIRPRIRMYKETYQLLIDRKWKGRGRGHPSLELIRAGCYSTPNIQRRVLVGADNV